MATLPQASPCDAARAELDAARYALLRRLAPALRHEAVGQLQPISMVASVLERRLESPEPDLAAVRDGVRRLTGSSRQAVQASLDLVGWLAPDPGRRVPLHEAVEDTLRLLRGPLGFNGFMLQARLEGLADPVPLSALRQVLPACLLWLADGAGPPAQVTVEARREAGRLLLDIGLEPTEGLAGEVREPAYRPLGLQEVQALAQAEGMGLQAQGDRMTLSLDAGDGGADR